MNDFRMLAGMALTGCVLSVLLRRCSRDIALLLSLAGGIVILLFAISRLTPVVQALRAFASKTGVSKEQLGKVVTLLYGALTAECAAQWCMDAGEEGLARKTLLAGQWLLLSLCVPDFLAIGELLFALLQTR